MEELRGKWTIKGKIKLLQGTKYYMDFVSLKTKYRKIQKISPGAYIFQRPFLRGLSTEGNLRLKIDWASLIVGQKFTVFALFYFVFEGNFPISFPPGAYI